MGEIIKSFLVSLGYDVDKASEKKFTSGLAEATKKVTLFAAAVQGMAAGVWYSVMQTAESLDNLSDVSGRVNVPVDKLEELGYIASQTDSSMEAVQSSLENLNSVIGQAALGVGRGAAMFKALGLEAKNADGSVKSTSQVLEEISGKIKDMSKGEQIAFLQRVGIDRTMVQMLSSDVSGLRNEFQKMYSTAGVDANEAAQAASDFMDEWGKLTSMSSMLYRAVNVGFMMKFKNDLIRLRKFIMDNADKIKKTLEVVMSAIIRIASAIGSAVMRIISWIQKIADWYSTLDDRTQNIIMTVGALIAAWKLLNLQFLATPLGVLIAALTGLFLIVDDLLTYLEGGESAIDWSQWEPQIAILTEFFTNLGMVVRAIGDAFVETWPLVQRVFGNMKDAGMALLTTLKEIGMFVVNVLTGNFEGALGNIKGLFSGLFNFMKAGLEIVRSQFDMVFGFLGKAVNNVRALFGLGDIDWSGFEKYGSVIKNISIALMGLGFGPKLLSTVFIKLAGSVGLVLSPFMKIVNIFKSSWGIIEKFAGNIGKLGTALWKFGGILGSKIIPVIGKLSTALWKFSVGLVTKVIPAVLKFTAALLANPITWVVIAVAALAAGLYLLVKNWDKVKAAVVAFVQRAKSKINELKEAIAQKFAEAKEKVLDKFADLLEWFKALPGRIRSALSAIGEKIGNLFQSAKAVVIEKFGSIVEWFKEIPGRITSAASSVADEMRNLFQNAKDGAIERFGFIIEWFAGLPGRIGAAISSIVEEIGNWFTTAKDGVVNKFGELIEWFKGLPGMIGDALAGLVDILLGPFQNAYNKIVGMWTDLKGFLGFGEKTAEEQEAHDLAVLRNNYAETDSWGVATGRYNEAGYEKAKAEYYAKKQQAAPPYIGTPPPQIETLRQMDGGYTNTPSPQTQAAISQETNNNQQVNINNNTDVKVYEAKDAAASGRAVEEAGNRVGRNTVSQVSSYAAVSGG